MLVLHIYGARANFLLFCDHQDTCRTPSSSPSLAMSSLPTSTAPPPFDARNGGTAFIVVVVVDCDANAAGNIHRGYTTDNKRQNSSLKSLVLVVCPSLFFVMFYCLTVSVYYLHRTKKNVMDGRTDGPI